MCVSDANKSIQISNPAPALPEPPAPKQNNVFIKAADRCIPPFPSLAEGGDYYEYIRGIKLNRKRCSTDCCNSESYT